jgi:hypothetical protein
MSVFYYCRICDIFDDMLDRASELPETTADLVELQNYLNECRDVTMYNLKEKIQTAAENVLFLMQHALLSRKRYFVIETVINEIIFYYYLRKFFIIGETGAVVEHTESHTSGSVTICSPEWTLRTVGQ